MPFKKTLPGENKTDGWSPWRDWSQLEFLFGGEPPLALKYITKHSKWDSHAQTFRSIVYVGQRQLSYAYQFQSSKRTCQRPRIP